MKVKVLTGRFMIPGMTGKVAEDARGLTGDGWRMVFVDPSLHPAEIVAGVDETVSLSRRAGYFMIYFISNVDHVMNRLRVLRKNSGIQELEFWVYGMRLGRLDRATVTVNERGECSSYPYGLLEEWNNQLLQLWAPE